MFSRKSLIFLKRSLVFPILLFSSIPLHCSLKKAFLCLLAILWSPAFSSVYLSLSLLFFSQLFVSPPQTIILPFCICFSCGWSLSLSPVQCHEPLSIVSQVHFNLEFTKIVWCSRLIPTVLGLKGSLSSGALRCPYFQKEHLLLNN